MGVGKFREVDRGFSELWEVKRELGVAFAVVNLYTVLARKLPKTQCGGKFEDMHCEIKEVRLMEG